MVDPQRLVESMRNVLHAGQAPPMDVVRGLTADYAEACQEVNRRLARCEEFLRQGLRAEAIQYAQTEPNVLDVLTVLDLPERPYWDQLLAACGLPPAPLFRMETAAALNRAYAEAQPMEHLLRQHRLLALSRAPVGERLAVLVQLAQVDAGNPVWQQDRAAFEAVRLQQLQGEVAALRRQPDVPSLEHVQALLQEVKGTPWYTPLPLELVSALEEMHQGVSSSHWQMRLGNLARELAAAGKSKDEPRARQLAGEWQQALGQCPLPPHDSRCVEVVPVLRWLERLQKQQANAAAHQQAVAALQQALRDPAIGDDQLEEIYFEAAEHRGGVPPNLEEAYRRRMAKLRTARQTWERLVLVGVAAVAMVAFVAGLVFLLTRSR
jgi:hypothetical protein